MEIIFAGLGFLAFVAVFYEAGKRTGSRCGFAAGRKLRRKGGGPMRPSHGISGNRRKKH